MVDFFAAVGAFCFARKIAKLFEGDGKRFVAFVSVAAITIVTLYA